MEAPSYTAHGGRAPWKEEWWPEARSPRQRANQSPRRGGGKGKKGGKEGLGKSKAAGPGKPDQSMAKPPTLDVVPAAPTAPTLVNPKPGQLADTGPSADRIQLEALLGALAGSSATLPPAAQQMIATLQENTAQSEARVMHKAVTEQARARQALTRVQAQRTAYLAAWHTYLGQLASLLESQLAEQSTVLENFDNSELMWTQADQGATQQLARLAGKEPPEAADRDGWRDGSGHGYRGGTAVTASYRGVAIVSQHEREGSRTPRRNSASDQKEPEPTGAQLPEGEKPAGEKPAEAKAGGGLPGGGPFKLGLHPGKAQS